MQADNGTPLGDADLRRLKTKIDAQGWGSLTIDEQARYQALLLELRPGDYVIYVNVPEWGRYPRSSEGPLLLGM